MPSTRQNLRRCLPWRSINRLRRRFHFEAIMHTFRTLGYTFVATLLTLVASNAQANLLTNGSFDSGTYSFGGDGAVDLPAGSTAITGWTVTTNDVAPISSSNVYSIVPEDGTVSLDLQSYTDASPYGAVQQTISTTAGSSYLLTFWIGVQNSIGYAAGPASVTASADGTSQLFSNTLSGANNQWQQFSLPFTASSGSTLITLAGTATAGGAYIGLDNADVEPTSTPEPASLSLLALATLPLAMRRRRS
jgi:hypothetical protein